VGPVVDFFFDLSSPYSYLAATQLPALAARHGATVRWRPMVLGAVFTATGNRMPAASPPKAAWMMQDLDRWAQAYGVPFRMNSRFPLNTIPAMRLVVLAEQAGAGQAATLEAFRRTWVTDEDPNCSVRMRSSTVPWRHEPVDEHRLVLPDAVRAIGGLRFDGRVPPRVDEEHVIGRGER
jgi:2-hydroxychromene-2-carboxylate isomerase